MEALQNETVGFYVQLVSPVPSENIVQPSQHITMLLLPSGEPTLLPLVSHAFCKYKGSMENNTCTCTMRTTLLNDGHTKTERPK